MKANDHLIHACVLLLPFCTNSPPLSATISIELGTKNVDIPDRRSFHPRNRDWYDRAHKKHMNICTIAIMNTCTLMVCTFHAYDSELNKEFYDLKLEARVCSRTKATKSSSCLQINFLKCRNLLQIR